MNDLDPPALSAGPPPVITFTEDEYLYGFGTLRLRVERVTVLRSEPGWALVGGVRIDRLGSAREDRDICVPLATLRQRLQPFPQVGLTIEPVKGTDGRDP